tara:strand:- start:269 stop:679 length:411 start_codon:yes stop_codon:yes gene_type:complete
MARIAGRNGQIYVQQAGAEAAPLAFVNKWSINATVDKNEVSAFGDSTRVYVAGLADAQGSFAGFFDDTATTGSAYLFSIATAGIAKKVYLYPTSPSTSGPYFFGTAFFDFTTDTDVANATSISGTFAAASAFNKVG